MKLLALAGRLQSGKDSLGDFLVRNRKELMGVETAKKYGWADALKQDLADKFDVPEHLLWGTDEDKNQPTSVQWWDLPHWNDLSESRADIKTFNANGGYLTIRELLQHWGTEICRSMREDIWVSLAMKRVKADNCDLAVMIDTRFPNEVAAVKAAGGKVVRLTRNEGVPTEHQSEYTLDKERYDVSNFDAVVANNQMTKTQAERVLVSLLDQWGWKT